jgi:uncharacterized protein YndB with AHSA1/START domain
VSVAGGALIRVPLPQVWEFLIKPENMHLWGPFTRPVTGFDRPFEAGDRVTLYRKDFFWHHSQVLLVEKVVPYHSLHLRDLSPGAARINVTATRERRRGPRIEKPPGFRKQSSILWAAAGYCSGLIAG